ncbi:ribulose-phosphate 3-epimerase [Nematocida sp. AWRm77]|nr:ribulose-phosphate 3-epimerase [Nematocida sp. AWRm77]
MKKKIWASILSCDLLCIDKEIERLKSLGIEALHIDIMDGALVPKVFLGEDFVQKIVEKFPELEIECHLMVCNPLNAFKNMNLDAINRVIVHNSLYMQDVGAYLQTHKCALGVAIAPHDDPEAVFIPAKTDKILTMGVMPGFGGQRLLPDTHIRLAQARKRWPQCVHGVDGGVNAGTIKGVLEADEFVLGSCLFQNDAQTELDTITEICKEEN